MMKFGMLLFTTFTLFSRSQSKEGATVSCPKDWHLAGKVCYKLSNTKSKSVEKAASNCETIIPTGSKLPFISKEADWKEIVEFANLKNVNLFWLGLSQNSSNKNQWLWRETVPVLFSTWQNPPTSFSYDTVPTGSNENSCAIAWVQKTSGKSGWVASKCSTDKNTVSTICRKRASLHVAKVHKANKNIDVDTISKAVTNIQLPNGKAVKMDINIEELRQMQEKHNLIGKLVATALGLGDKFKGSKSPLRGDNMISSADLHKEFEKLSEKLGGGNGLKRPVGNLTQGTSQISELFRPKRSNPVEDNNWGSKRTIKYNYAKTFAKTENKHVFDEALKFWQQNTCFNFTLSEDPDVLAISGGGCYSTVGKAKHKPPQTLSLGDGCGTLAIASHEVGHLLGLAHEQARPDRDLHVEVFMANIDPNYIDNFRTCCDCAEKNEYKYDYGSVMHYTSTEFSSNGAPTILPKDPDYWRSMGIASEPSFLDVKTVNDANCKDYCQNSNIKCQNGGYPHPRNCKICLCPPGFGGFDCSKFAYVKGSTCGQMKELQRGYFEFKTPNFPRPLKGGTCAWVFKAPKGEFVELEFLPTLFDLPEECYYGYVEIKDSTDFTATGKRFCTSVSPPKITSEGNMMVVLLNILNPEEDYHGFKAKVRAVASRPISKSKLAQSSVTPPPSKGGQSSCASVSGSVQNAGPAGYSLREDNE